MARISYTEKEVELLEKILGSPECMNIAPGGSSPPSSKGKKMSEEFCEKNLPATQWKILTCKWYMRRRVQFVKQGQGAAADLGGQACCRYAKASGRVGMFCLRIRRWFSDSKQQHITGG